jgi:hypothetical protein
MLTDCMHKFEIMSIANMNQLFVDFNANLSPTPPEEKSSDIPKPFSGKALIESGDTSGFISPHIVEDFCLCPKKHTTPKKQRVIDGQEVDSGLVTQFVTFTVKIRDHVENIDCHVANIGNNDLVLGMSWLKIHNPSTHQSIGTIAEWCSHLLLLQQLPLLAGSHPNQRRLNPDQIQRILQSVF